MRIGKKWEYVQIESWPWQPGTRFLDNIILEVTQELYEPGRKFLLEPIKDYGDLSKMWRDSTISHIEVEPHYMTIRSQNRNVVTDIYWWVRGNASIISDGGMITYADLWAKVRKPTRRGYRCIVPKKIPGLGKIRHPTVRTIGPVYLIEPVGGSLGWNYTPCYLANSVGGLIDLTRSVVNYPLDHIVFRYRCQAELTTMLKIPIPGELRISGNKRSARLMVPNLSSELWGWASSSWGWIVKSRDTSITVPAGTYRCMEIIRFGPGMIDRQTRFYLLKEYWAPRVGLIARIDMRPGGEGIWVLGSTT